MTCLFITSASQKVTLSLAHSPREVIDGPLSKTAQDVVEALQPKVARPLVQVVV